MGVCLLVIPPKPHPTTKGKKHHSFLMRLSIAWGRDYLGIQLYKCYPCMGDIGERVMRYHEALHGDSLTPRAGAAAWNILVLAIFYL